MLGIDPPRCRINSDTPQLVVYTVEVGSSTARALPLLAAWGAGNAAEGAVPEQGIHDSDEVLGLS